MIFRFIERSNGHDVMDVRIVTEFVFRFRTPNARVSIAFQRSLSNVSPASPVRFVTASFPVRMIRAGESRR
ncbi:hypothetical protein C450_09377 [Halococcus salifodinae DSM 8989]|uniref:Uncharacterized protein n=1 Tax=Halococcus salifodinae DSM 8989 TaxID=1227456 RepID=M0N6I2_9EURY|nr:hypothetical protein C450_09377 [Halococcus salifodinae DSM 8989]